MSQHRPCKSLGYTPTQPSRFSLTIFVKLMLTIRFERQNVTWCQFAPLLQIIDPHL